MNTYDPNFIPRKDYFIVGQKAIVYNEQKQLLLLKRAEKSGSGGRWPLPGGALEKDEDPIEGIKREIMEETELEVLNINPFGIRSYKNNEDSVIIVGYSCSVKTTVPKLNWEHTAYEWLSREEALKKELTSDGRYFLECSS